MITPITSEQATFRKCYREPTNCNSSCMAWCWSNVEKEKGSYTYNRQDHLCFYSIKIQYFLSRIVNILKMKDNKIRELENELYDLKYNLKKKLGLD